MVDITPKTVGHKLRICERENLSLRDKVETLEAELAHYREQVEKLTTGSIPQIVKNWMHEYKLPWEMFWCYEHEQWITELDTSFPFHSEQSSCEECDK